MFFFDTLLERRKVFGDGNLDWSIKIKKVKGNYRIIDFIAKLLIRFISWNEGYKLYREEFDYICENFCHDPTTKEYKDRRSGCMFDARQKRAEVIEWLVDNREQQFPISALYRRFLDQFFPCNRWLNKFDTIVNFFFVRYMKFFHIPHIQVGELTGEVVCAKVETKKIVNKTETKKLAKTYDAVVLK